MLDSNTWVASFYCEKGFFRTKAVWALVGKVIKVQNQDRSVLAVDLTKLYKISSGTALDSINSQVAALSPTKFAALWNETVNNSVYSPGWYVKIFNVSGYSVSDSVDLFQLVVSSDAVNGKPLLAKINSTNFVVVYSEDDTSNCTQGGENNSTLRAQAYKSSDTFTVSENGSTHVIDRSLKTFNPTFAITRWEDDKIVVVWGSTFDDPQGEVTSRGKLAILSYDDLKETSFLQETFDLYLNIPSNYTQWAPMSIHRFSSTKELLVGSAGQKDVSVHSYTEENATPNTAALVPTYTDAIDTGFWPTGVPTKFYPVADTWDGGSAVKLSDGRILYIWTDSNSVKFGYASSETVFFGGNSTITNITTLISGLSSPNATVTRMPDGYLYLFVQTMAYSTIYPEHIIQRSTDEGASWSDYSRIQAPNLTGILKSWDSAATQEIHTPQSLMPMGIPFVTSANRWILPAVYFLQETIEGSTVSFTRPAIWTSDNDGISWVLRLSNSYGFNGTLIPTWSRNIVEYEDRLYWATSSEFSPVGGFTFWVSADGGSTWTKQFDYSYSSGSNYRAPALLAAADTQNNATINMMDSTGAFFATSDLTPNTNPYTTGTQLGSYSFPDRGFPTIQRIDSYYMFHEGGRMFGVPVTQPSYHSGVKGYIVDLCSPSAYSRPT
jgi:hypothetical protein